jgi:hypothetical protein
MRIYMFEADLFCHPCGEAIAATLPAPDEWEREHPDSDSHPVAYDSSEGQSDTPDHCGQCNLFLERNLTEDGIEYVRDCVAEDLCTEVEILGIVRQWVDFYGIDIGDCVDEDVKFWRDKNGLPAICMAVQVTA